MKSYDINRFFTFVFFIAINILFMYILSYIDFKFPFFAGFVSIGVFLYFIILIFLHDKYKKFLYKLEILFSKKIFLLVVFIYILFMGKTLFEAYNQKEEILHSSKVENILYEDNVFIKAFDVMTLNSVVHIESKKELNFDKELQDKVDCIKKFTSNIEFHFKKEHDKETVYFTVAYYPTYPYVTASTILYVVVFYLYFFILYWLFILYTKEGAELLHLLPLFTFIAILYFSIFIISGMSIENRAYITFRASSNILQSLELHYKLAIAKQGFNTYKNEATLDPSIYFSIAVKDNK